MNQASWYPARKAREWMFRVDERLRRPTAPTIPAEAHAAALVGWLLRAQRANPDDGVAQSYDALRRAWAPSYPETTGYIICSLLHAARSGIGRPDMIRYAAIRMGAWLVSIQQPDGAFEGGHVGQGTPPAVFNTAQILDGFSPTFCATDSTPPARSGQPPPGPRHGSSCNRTPTAHGDAACPG